MSLPPIYQSGHHAPANTARAAEEWEEWEDDHVITPIDAAKQTEVCPSAIVPAPLQDGNTKAVHLRASSLSTPKVRRIRSRQRQKAQNARAGIRLITDMSVFRRNTGRKGKFVDAAALRALEGEPSSASVGSWNWLNEDAGKKSESTSEMRSNRNKNRQLSPQDRAIVIGISLESSDIQGRQMCPQTALTGNSTAPFPAAKLNDRHVPHEAKTDVQGHKSVWSPDTPDTPCSFGSNHAASSVYSQLIMRTQAPQEEMPPPVPELPSNYDRTTHQRTLSLESGKSRHEDDESDTPCTLFEEDGAPSPQKHLKSKEFGIGLDSASSRSHGWWDHVVTPFLDKKMSFPSPRYKTESPKSPKSPKFRTETFRDKSRANLNAADEHRSRPSPSDLVPVLVQAPIVRALPPRRTPSTQSDTGHAESPQDLSTEAQIPVVGPSTRQTPRIVISCDDSPSASDIPPPYSPPKKKQDDKPARYRAVFPPGHPLRSQFPPTPRPASPGLAGTMTSQRGHQKEQPLNHAPAVPMTQIQPVFTEPLPVRAVGTFVPLEHACSAAGGRHKVERRRRRHEKEDMIARRAGGLWRGRGCVSSRGCFGRTGREGRKRRRVWMAIWAGTIALMLLIVLLAVLLTRQHSPAETRSIWVNLTGFPPMPTGVLTVVGPDNTAARSVCTEPSTLWSCSLPKDQQPSVLPYKANQPTLIMQIQWDNGTRRAWNAPDGDAPETLSRRALGAAAHAMSVLRRDAAPTEFFPDPAAPKFKEVWFLGETTDNIKSEQKGGERAPFYISLLRSTNDTVPTPKLSRRGVSPNIGNATFKDIIPPPDVERDGTSAPAVMMPTPVQQPVRLFDRGLPTEHYGFYTYFERTIFVKSVTIQNNTDSNMPLDEDGGCRKTEASHLVTWGDTRLHVQIWTRALSSNASSLLKPDGSKGIGSTGELVRPGTMPYPVTITQDTHGGNPDRKLVWDRPIDDRMQVATTEAQALVNNMGNGGTWVNRRGTGNAKFGGFDGGSGGCKCEWVNWV
ncbi:Glycoprotease family protein [Metarhizium album ARSEF 1941]|uniref:Glycoprotease family protein n=1 Tax=Metarhizium album (strain ARSEF 1941) TaxID=1081103 RepID=A0A0B2WQ87_METAS|nr:Glycoprotease family protein [Metarhizium album ARSEF 1941]KHN95160.1 Glycoprotease family protein [Metarhizium album ARSEF 1941]